MTTRFLLTYLAQVRRFLEGLCFLLIFPSLKLRLTVITMRRFSPIKLRENDTVLRKAAVTIGIARGVDK